MVGCCLVIGRFVSLATCERCEPSRDLRHKSLYDKGLGEDAVNSHWGRSGRPSEDAGERRREGGVGTRGPGDVVMIQ